MNTNQTNNSQVVRGPGRPRNANITRILNLDADTKLPMKKGRMNHGKQILQINVQRSVKASQFVWGETPIVGDIKEITVAGKVKASPTINVVVVEPQIISAPQEESAEIQTTHESLSSAGVPA